MIRHPACRKIGGQKQFERTRQVTKVAKGDRTNPLAIYLRAQIAAQAG